jgi:catechol 2,3-dioxygenase-like lactoylglutathione lyase family enzyme
MNERRMRIAGIHHVTLLVADVERSLAFYRNVLGLRLVKQTVNDDDQNARHFIFGDAEGKPGTLITCLEYPDLDEGRHRPVLALRQLGGRPASPRPPSPFAPVRRRSARVHESPASPAWEPGAHVSLQRVARQPEYLPGHASR